MSIYGLSAQVDTVVTSTGELGSLGGDFEFVYETGQIVSFPRLAITGEILYYAPLVTTDSVPSATISATAATVYANIVFNGWYETVSSQGFQICADGTFTSNVQTVLVIPEQSYANCTPPCAHNSFQHTFTDLTPGSTYYVRAFATNQSGTAYGSVLSFKTLAILPTISVNTSVIDVTSSSATVSNGITSDGGAMVTGRGVCWGTDHNPSLSGNHTSDGNGIGNFYSTITGLLPNTTYYVRTYATNSVGTNYGNEVSFTTPCDVVSVTINGNTNICAGTTTTLTATQGYNSYQWSGGQVSGNTTTVSQAGTYSVTVTDAYGCQNSAQVTVSVNALPTVTATANPATICAGQSATLTASGADSYSWDNSLGTGNGKQVTPAKTTIYHVTGTVSATGCTGSGQVTVTVNPTPAVPTLSANANTLCVGNNGSITVTTPTGNGCSYSINGTDFQAGTTFSGLSANTYAVTVKTAQGCTNSAQATVGNSTVTPTVAATANPASVCAGQGATLTASGADSYSWDNSLGTGNGKQVTPATTTTYHVTGTVTATGCTGSGQVTVTVTSCATVPTVTTSTASAITYNSATVAANVTSDGGATVTERGVCWSTNHNPVNTGSHSTSGSGTGSYSVNLTGLSSSTTYYVRAYAINSVGVSYGSEVSFTTAIYNTNKPVAYTNTVSVMHSTSATLSGRYSNSGPAITQVGFYYGTTPESLNSSISGNSITVNADGTFSGTISGLTSGTSYYFKAFASNANGTAYGSVKNFRTLDSETAYNQACPNARTVSDTDGNVYNTVLIGNQCWMRENLRTTRTPGGTEIPVGTNSTYNSLTSLRYYPNGDPSLVNQYGYLYNRYCATQNGISNNSPSGVQGVCPNNWHLPSNTEWETLVTYVSNQYTYAAVALASQKDWQSYTGNNTPGKNPSNNNSTGFSALPAGIYANHGDAYLQRSCFWTTTKNASGYYLQCFIIYSNSNVTTGSAHYSVHWGMSVRCIKD